MPAEEKIVANMTIEEKIEAIKKSKSYNDVKPDWFPPYYQKEYYFVSYCHADYKLVYESLHKLQDPQRENALTLWYDHDLTPGRDWESEAKRYIYDFNCKGVIFYVSENAVLSQSIHKEIEFVKNYGKAYMSINLPCQAIAGHEGEYLSAADMLELLKEDHDVGNYDEKAKVLKETFNDRVTFVRFDQDVDTQIDCIRRLKRQPLLEIAKDGVVTAINDINAEEIKKEDFAYIDEDGKRRYAHMISDCAFANCRLLQKVDLPKFFAIYDYAFVNCRSLQKIDLSKKGLAISCLADGIFQGCSSLESITIPNSVSSIGDSAFADCEKLESVIFGEDSFLTVIGKEAFAVCTSLSSITIPDGVEVIGEDAFALCEKLESVIFGENSNLTFIDDRAFYGCKSLARITIPSSVESIGVCVFEGCKRIENVIFDEVSCLKTIEGGAFCECKSLSSITVPKSVEYLGDCAFEDCKKLTDIYYLGSKRQWKKIEKGEDWDKGTPDYTVHCTDGDLKKGEF